MKKLLIIVALLLLLAAGGINYYGWDNIKLQLTQFWGYVTLGNNPLLPTMDRDLRVYEQQTADKPRIERHLLVAGGPTKDGIPSIDRPKFVKPDNSSYGDEATVIGVHVNGEAKAYPYGILNWHEIVNDTVGGVPVSVTMCPLCDTNPVFVRQVNGQTTTFGVSGKLYQNCLVMYDRASDSLWLQVWGMGVAGRYTNHVLERVPAVKTTLGRWQQKHPDTVVLSTETGYTRDYHRYPYGDYKDSRVLVFHAKNQHKLDSHPKAIISYVVKHGAETPTNRFAGASVRAYHDVIQKQGPQVFQLGEREVVAKWDETLQTVRFYDTQTGQLVPSSTAFAFVYPAYFEQ